MKLIPRALSILCLLMYPILSPGLEVKILKHYSDADSESIWVDAKTDRIPEILMGNESIVKPSASYANVFPKAFLQENFFTVCFQNCQNDEALKIKKGEIENLDDWNVIEQTNVYFWLNSYFKFLEEELHYRPKQFLKVMTNREIQENGKLLTNNAFFNPSDISLSFLPATKSILFKMMGGKINRSGFDPSVVIHEASHYIFHHLFPYSMNTEIGGLNEGFADYMANVFLDNSKIGLVMLHGKALRNSASIVDSKKKMKIYNPRMEVHQLGERVAYALWSTRNLADDLYEYDRLVIDAIEALKQNPYSTIHHFKEKMLDRIPYIISPANTPIATKIWDDTFPNKVIEINNFDFFDKPSIPNSTVGFKTKHILPKKLANEMGIAEVSDFNFSVIRKVAVSKDQEAILMANEINGVSNPYWLVIDKLRSNILGVFSIDRKLVTAPEELKKIKELASQATDENTFTSNFESKIKNFTDLYFGQGAYSSSYKILSRKVTSTAFEFNGETINGKIVEMKLKRGFLVGLLMGIPEIDGLSLYTVPSKVTKSEIEGQSVVGYKLLLKNGTTIQVIMNKKLI